MTGLKFLIVIPTVRQALPGFEMIMERVRSSLTHPTDLHILDGKPNKPETLNRAFDDLLVPSDCDAYVTMDDDYLPADGWQDLIADGFQKLPNGGAFGIWLGDSPKELEIMGSSPRTVGPRQEIQGLIYRRVIPPHHIAGAMIAFRKESAIAVGKQPQSDLNYQIWEDAWRGRRVQKTGKDLIYLEGVHPEMYEYDDPPEYVRQKEEDVLASEKLTQEFLRKGGVGDPLSIQLRRFAGKIKRKLRP